MARVRRYRQGWILIPALVGSALVQGGGAAAYQALRPVPPPEPWTLTLSVAGEGTGTVVATLAGDLVPFGRCAAETAPCRFDVPRDRYVTLTAVRGEKMTFEGWRGCEAHAEDVLGCELMAFTSRQVTAVFGKVPDTVEVAWIEAAIKEPAVKLPAAPKPKPKEKIEAERLEEEAVQVALVKPPPPPPPVPLTPPPPPPPAEQPPPPPAIPQNLTAVEVDDDDHLVEDAPDDATMISDKNRDVAEQTRATETNLDRESKGKEVASAESEDTTSPDIGGPEERIAHLETSESDLEEVDRKSDHSGEDDAAKGQLVGEAGKDGEGGTGAAQTGLLAMRGIGGRGALLGERVGDGKKQGKKGAPGLKTTLDFDAYERIIGKDKAEEERMVARARMTAKKGRYERRMDAVKSALENFIPDVRPGNQTLLKTRAHPFAVYVARMHRRIHEHWGFGFLVDLDDKGSNHPLNDMELVTTLELVVNPDGTLYKTTVVRTSGRTDYDVAAIDSVMNAAPFEKPPTDIRSVDQRVYLHWSFFRGPRQCHPSNVAYYILDSIPGGVVPLDGKAPVATAGGGEVTAPTSGDLAPIEALSNNRQVSYAANMWVAGLTSRSIQRLMKASSVPFTAAGATAATTTGDLQSLYEGLLGELGTVKGWELTSPAEFTKKTGIPAAVAADRMIILVTTSQEKLGVVLSPIGSGEYRVTQLLR